MISAIGYGIQGQVNAYSTFANFKGKLFDFFYNFSFSKVGPYSKPGVVQSVTTMNAFERNILQSSIDYRDAGTQNQ